MFIKCSNNRNQNILNKLMNKSTFKQTAIDQNQIILVQFKIIINKTGKKKTTSLNRSKIQVPLNNYLT